MLALTMRLIFSHYSGVSRFGGDLNRYDEQSNNILLGQFNL